MPKILTSKGSLFDAPKKSIICHAVNCRGVWGSGIAKQFADKYPKAYQLYTKLCKEKGDSLVGSCQLISAGDLVIGCLFTSRGFGKYVDGPYEILKNTHLAVKDLLEQNTDGYAIHMCKINSGLFAVPWEDTLKVLESFDREFTVWEY
jgi:ADP-ribose 1''-phosphate phosphatase